MHVEQELAFAFRRLLEGPQDLKNNVGAAGHFFALRNAELVDLPEDGSVAGEFVRRRPTDGGTSASAPCR